MHAERVLLIIKYGRVSSFNEKGSRTVNQQQQKQKLFYQLNIE